MAEALEKSGMFPIKEYIKRRQVTVAAQVACWPIYELCMGADIIPGASRFVWRWYQDVGREVE